METNVDVLASTVVATLTTENQPTLAIAMAEARAAWGNATGADPTSYRLVFVGVGDRLHGGQFVFDYTFSVGAV